MPPLLHPLLICTLLLVGCHRQAPGPPAPPPPTTLTFFVVSNEKIAGGRYIDTPELPHLGYIKATPDMTITSAAAVIPSAEPPGPFRMGITGNIDSGGMKSRPALIIEMLAGDANKYSQLTADAVDHKLMIMLNGKPLTVRLIAQPVKDGKLIFIFQDHEHEQKVQDEMERLVQ